MPFLRLSSSKCYEPDCTRKRITSEMLKNRSSRWCLYHFNKRKARLAKIRTSKVKIVEGVEWMRQDTPPYPHTQEVHWPHPEIAGATPTMEWPLVLVSQA